MRAKKKRGIFCGRISLHETPPYDKKAEKMRLRTRVLAQEPKPSSFAELYYSSDMDKKLVPYMRFIDAKICRNKYQDDRQISLQ